jgi:hypothetical protein
MKTYLQSSYTSLISFLPRQFILLRMDNSLQKNFGFFLSANTEHMFWAFIGFIIALTLCFQLYTSRAENLKEVFFGEAHTFSVNNQSFPNQK